MLGSMRANKKNQTVVWVILGLLALGLVGFGGVTAGGGTIRSIGQVGDEKISVDGYALGLNNALSNLSQQIGRNVTATEAEAFGIQGNVLNNLLTTAALDNETGKLGISVGDNTVRTQLLLNPSFQGLDGNFDRESYEYTLERSGLSPSEYDTILRKEAARSLLQAAVMTGVKSQGTQTKALLAFDRETRDFTWVKLTDDMLDAPIASPSDEQLSAQYKDTPEAYTAPLTREITYAWLSPEMLSEQVSIDDAQIKESYDLQPDRFQKPEKRNVERIVFGSNEEATEARNALDAGSTSFDAILNDRGLTSADVDLGDVERGGISTEAAEVIFSSDSPGVIGPVQSSLGPALFRINAILAEDITSFEDARFEIVGELAGEAARRLVTDLITDIDDLLAAGATIEELASDTDMELGKISFTADTSDGIAAYENFRTIASQSKKADFPEINELADGGIFALRVDEIKQPALRALADVREQVISDWTKAEKVRQLTKHAEVLKASLENGDGFGDLETNSEANIRRVGFVENTPPQMLTDMFVGEPGKITVASDTDNVFVALLDKVNNFDESTEDNQQLVNAVQEQLDAGIARDILSSFSNALRSDAGVYINQEALNQINAQITGGGY